MPPLVCCSFTCCPRTNPKEGRLRQEQTPQIMNSEGGQHASGKRLIIELKVRRDAMIVFGWRNSTLNYNFNAPLMFPFCMRSLSLIRTPTSDAANTVGWTVCDMGASAIRTLPAPGTWIRPIVPSRIVPKSKMENLERSRLSYCSPMSSNGSTLEKTTFNDFSYIIHLASPFEAMLAPSVGYPTVVLLEVPVVVQSPYPDQFMPGLIIALMFIQLRIKSSMRFFHHFLSHYILYRASGRLVSSTHIKRVDNSRKRGT